MDLYIMRHGTTVFNEKGIIQGRSRNRLSKSGKALAEESATKLKDVKLDAIFSSPLIRTMQTANIMNKYHGLKIIKDERIIEVDQGIFTGRKKASLTEEEKRLKREAAPGTNVETRQHIINRLEDFLKSLKGQKYNSVLVITHNINASIIDALILGKPLEDVKQTFGNAEIRKYVL